MKKILNTIWVMGMLSLAVFCLSACDRDLDVQQSYPFTVETMPVQKDIVKGTDSGDTLHAQTRGRFC